jgi:predicted nucleic acid-binding Zn ribbon protein
MSDTPDAIDADAIRRRLSGRLRIIQAGIATPDGKAAVDLCIAEIQAVLTRTRPCVACGEPLPSGQGQGNRRYCSSDCQDASRLDKASLRQSSPQCCVRLQSKVTHARGAYAGVARTVARRTPRGMAASAAHMELLAFHKLAIADAERKLAEHQADSSAPEHRS